MHLTTKKWEALGEPKLTIYFNGKEIKNIVELNEEEGWLIREQVDEHGSIIIDMENDCILKETLHGEVKVDIDMTKNWLGDELGTPTEIKRSEVNSADN